MMSILVLFDYPEHYLITLPYFSDPLDLVAYFTAPFAFAQLLSDPPVTLAATGLQAPSWGRPYA